MPSLLTRDLSPLHRKLLYRSFVVPIAIYRYRLWFFKGARVKRLLKVLEKMQRRAAL